MGLGEPGYLSFLLRLWRVDDGQAKAWRASLQNALTGQRQGFADLVQLMAFLRQQTDDSGNPGPGLPGSEAADQTLPEPPPHS
jgi:hypothetical protein